MEEWFSDSDNSKNFPRLKSSESQKRRSLGRTGSRLFVKKQLRDLRKGLYQKILRKITAGLSTDVLEQMVEKNAFYYSPLQKFSKEEGMPWFSRVPIGKNTLDQYVKDMCLEAGIEGKTNHFLRSTAQLECTGREFLKRLFNLGPDKKVLKRLTLMKGFHQIKRGVCAMFLPMLLISSCLLDKLSVVLS